MGIRTSVAAAAVATGFALAGSAVAAPSALSTNSLEIHFHLNSATGDGFTDTAASSPFTLDTFTTAGASASGSSTPEPWTGAPNTPSDITIDLSTLADAPSAAGETEFAYASLGKSFEVKALKVLTLTTASDDTLDVGYTYNWQTIVNGLGFGSTSIVMNVFGTSEEAGNPFFFGFGLVRTDGSTVGDSGSHSDGGVISLSAGKTYDVFIQELVLTSQAQAVPEPKAWTLLIAGFGLAGAALRRRRRLAPRAIA
jgi:hypothetical protein